MGLPIDIQAKALYHRMSEDGLPAVPFHEFGKYAIPHIQRPGDSAPEESDEDDEEIMDSYEQYG